MMDRVAEWMKAWEVEEDRVCSGCQSVFEFNSSVSVSTGGTTPD